MRSAVFIACIAAMLLVPPAWAVIALIRLRTTGLEQEAWWAKVMTLLTVLTWLSCLWWYAAHRAMKDESPED